MTADDLTQWEAAAKAMQAEVDACHADQRRWANPRVVDEYHHVANPLTMLALIARVRELEAQVQEAPPGADGICPDCYHARPLVGRCPTCHPTQQVQP